MGVIAWYKYIQHDTERRAVSATAELCLFVPRKQRWRHELAVFSWVECFAYSTLLVLFALSELGPIGLSRRLRSDELYAGTEIGSQVLVGV